MTERLTTKATAAQMRREHSRPIHKTLWLERTFFDKAVIPDKTTMTRELRQAQIATTKAVINL